MGEFGSGLQKNILDRWILSRLKEVIDNVTTNLEKYDAFAASSDIEEFVDDFSNWYLRRSRERAGVTNLSKTDKASFFNTFYFVLNNLVKLLAPFLPFISEIVYKNLTKEVSVHLSDWPEFAYDIEKDLLEEMKKVREVVEKAHAVRKLKNIPVRQPLSKLKVTNLVLKEKEVLKLIKDELNVKDVFYSKGSGDVKVEFDTKITPELIEEAKTRELIRNIQQERKNMGINLDQYVTVKSLWIPLDKMLVQYVKNIAMVSHIGKGIFKVEVD